MTEMDAEAQAAMIKATTDIVMDTLIKSGAVKSPKARREQVSWERLLAFEYIRKFYATYPHWVRVEVGSLPPGKEGNYYAKTRRWADIIIRMPDHMLIIETKMKAKPDVAAQLLNYARLLPLTPLFTKYKDLPIKLKMVAALVDDETREFIESHGIEVEEFRPENYEAWYKWAILKER